MPVNRAIVAQRLAATAPENRPGIRRGLTIPVARDLSLRHKPVPPLRAGITKSRATKLTAVQRSANDNGRSLWSASPYVRPGSTEATPKWDHTVSTVAGR